jgi:hypothetical protein
MDRSQNHDIIKSTDCELSNTKDCNSNRRKTIRLKRSKVMSPVHWGTVDIVEIPPYTEEEAKDVWYDGQEMQHISSTLWKTVDQLNRERAPLNESKDDDDHCTRGLEEMTTRGTLARLMAKYSIDQAVFEEQKKQKERGTKDARALANASIAESKRYVHKALEYGVRDQESAEE